MGRLESDWLTTMGIVVNPDEIADASSGINMGGWLSNVRSGGSRSEPRRASGAHRLNMSGSAYGR